MVVDAAEPAVPAPGVESVGTWSTVGSAGAVVPVEGMDGAVVGGEPAEVTGCVVTGWVGWVGWAAGGVVPWAGWIGWPVGVVWTALAGGPWAPVVPGWGGSAETLETCCVVVGTAGAVAPVGPVGAATTGVSETGGAIGIAGVVAIVVLRRAFAAASSAAVGRPASVPPVSPVSVVVGCAAETTTRGAETCTGAAAICCWVMAGLDGRIRRGW